MDLNTAIKCPFCRDKIPIVRAKVDGHEVLENVKCPHCKRSMGVGFAGTTNLPHLMAYCGGDEGLGLQLKSSENQERKLTYPIEYHEDSIDFALNSFCRNETDGIVFANCAMCGLLIPLNRPKEKEDFGLFCNVCARRTNARWLHDHLINIYDEEQALLKEKETQKQEESKDQEENIMKIKSTIIGFVLQDGETYKIYNPQTNQLANLSKADFESMCLGEFPYRKIRANVLTDGQVVEDSNGKIYYVADAKKNELFDFSTGKIERSAVVTNLLINTNQYMKYVPVLKKYCTFADVAAGHVDCKIAKLIEVISNDIQTGGESGNENGNVVAKMVRFLADPSYAEILDVEALEDMVMADPQAMMLKSQMATMRLADAIVSGQGVPLSIQNQQTVKLTDAVTDDLQKRSEETEQEYEIRLKGIMVSAVEKEDYILAGKCQEIMSKL